MLSSIARTVAKKSSANVKIYCRYSPSIRAQYGVCSGHTEQNSARPINITTKIITNPRWKSTMAAPKVNPSPTTCPFTGKKSPPPSSPNTPTLKHVRSLPFVGSIIFPQLTGIPPNMDQPYSFWPEMRRRYGDFYTWGFPAVGSPRDVYHTTYVTTDPREYATVIRSGGSHPFGMAELSWPTRSWARIRGRDAVGNLSGTGEEWKRVRNFFQKDLLHPTAADGYVPGFIRAAGTASRSVKKMSGNLNEFLNRAAFDMFSSLMLGDFPGVADVENSNEENERFVQAAVNGLGGSTRLMRGIKDKMLLQTFGFETEPVKEVNRNMDVCWEIGHKKVLSFLERREKGELDEMEKFSYLNRAVERLENDGGDLTMKDVEEMAFGGLFAGVDTTGGKMAWNLLHVARLPHVQEKLYDELSTAIRTVGNDGALTPDVLKRENTPYLHAIIRESHRLTPVSPIYIKRIGTDVSRDVRLFDTSLKPGDTVLLDCTSLGRDPSIVSNPEEFIPERWYDDAVRERKGTPREVIDHPLLRDPFSQGARKCPGSRVAHNEIETLMATIFWDWKVTSPVREMRDVVYGQRTVTQPVLPTLEFEARR